MEENASLRREIEQTLMGGCPPTNHENSDMAFVARGLVPRHTPAEDKPRRYVAELFSKQIKQKLSELEERMPEEKVIVLREISREEAKEEIRQLFSSGRTLYYSDIAEELRLDLELVVAICHELQESGELRIDESVLRTW